MFLLIDNYDSFTWNLYHYFLELGAEVTVVRNDEISAGDIKAMDIEGIILSPGPCTPDQSGICLDVIKTYAETKPILGVCLGHQAIGQVFGGNVIRAAKVMHGKISPIEHTGTGLFKGIDSPFNATRYHSLILDLGSLPDCFDITAKTADGIIMGIQHKELPLHGVQFHPESIASDFGHKLLENFLEICKSYNNE